ncbi:hypothetical protein GCM10022285_13400 [Streptomyces tunisiensis]|uniref:Uncharacterized protein n=1 Tax=Streptomyces tunisiensis TaxID=948699 RepID=A0ABP7Y013_9ACTN
MSGSLETPITTDSPPAAPSVVPEPGAEQAETAAAVASTAAAPRMRRRVVIEPHIPLAGKSLLHISCRKTLPRTAPPPVTPVAALPERAGARRGPSRRAPSARPRRRLSGGRDGDYCHHALVTGNRCDTGAALATVIGKSGSGPHGQPLGSSKPGKAEPRAVVPVSQETGQGASTIHEVLERVC